MKVNNPNKHYQILEKGYKNCNLPYFHLHFKGPNNVVYWLTINYNNKNKAIEQIRETEKQENFIKWVDYGK